MLNGIIIGFIVFIMLAIIRYFKGDVNNSHSILNSARKGDIVRLQKCIDEGYDVNFQGSGGMTALMFASSSGHIKAVEYLINHEASLDIQSNDGYTALAISALRNHKEIVELLLNSGADKSIIIKDGLDILSMIQPFPDGFEEVISMLQGRASLVYNNLFDYLDSGKKNLTDNEKRDFIRVVANTYIESTIRSQPEGIKPIMSHEVKRRQLLYFLYGALDYALSNFGRNELFDSQTENSNLLINENNLIWEYFQEDLEYKIEECLNIPIVCSQSTYPNEKLGFDRDAMLNLVVKGGNDLKSFIEQTREWIASANNDQEIEFYRNSSNNGSILALLYQD